MDWGTRAPKTFRGTSKRIRRIRMSRREHILIWLFVAWLVVLLFVMVPYMARHPQTENKLRSYIGAGR